MPAARRKAKFSNKQPGPGQGRAGQGRGQGRAEGQGRERAGYALQGRAGQGRAGQGSRAGQGRAGQAGAGAGQGGQGRARERAGQGRAGQGRAGAPQQAQSTSMVVGLGSIFLNKGREVIRGAASLQSSCTGRLHPPSPCCRDARPGASEPRAPMQMVSGALGSLGV